MRVLRFRDMSSEATFDLNLAPMMDMLVSIIPFMLLSATFLQVMLINVPLPTPVAKALAEDRQKDQREVSIKIKMDIQKGFAIEVRDEKGKASNFYIARNNNAYDYTAFHKRLVDIKQRFPKVFRVELNPDEAVDYKSIVGAMDAARNMENADPKIYIEKAETPLLFPDVILSNVMG